MNNEQKKTKRNFLFAALPFKKTKTINSVSKTMNYLQALVAICLLLNTIHCAPPTVYYANVGDTVALRCTSGGGNYACFSTYAFQNQAFKMVYLNSSRKYQVSPGSIGVTNVQATDAGYYACSNDCAQMKIDQISYYLQPTRNYIFFLKL